MRTLTTVALTNVPLPGNPTSQVCPAVIGWDASQLGWDAVRVPPASGAEMFPFHGVPEIEALPPSWNTISNAGNAGGKGLLVIRRPPLTPPLHALVVSTSTV